MLGPGNLVNTRYAFKCWNTQADGKGTNYQPGSTLVMGASNLTLYAVWVDGYIVTYDGNGNTGGGVPVDYQCYLPGRTVTVLGNIGSLFGNSTSGFYFYSWNTKADGSGTAFQGGAIFPMPSQDVTLYAIYTTVISQPVIVTPINPGVTVVVVPSIITIAVANIYYYGGGNDSGTVPVDSNGYVSGSTVTVRGNTGNLSKTGYDFCGWTDGYATYQPNDSFPMPARDVTLVASWSLTHHAPISTRYWKGNVLYFGNGADGGSVPEDRYPYDLYNPVTVLGNTGVLYRTGYTFGGWNTQADGGGTTYQPGATFNFPYEEYSFTSFGLYAIWNNPQTYYKVTYTLSIQGVPGTPPSDPNNYQAGQTATVANSGNLEPIGGYFDGWSTQASGSGTIYQPGDTFQMPLRNVTLYAIFMRQHPYFVCYNGNGNAGGTAPIESNRYAGGYQPAAVVTVTGSGSLIAPNGKYFGGWNTNADGSGTTYQGGNTFSMPSQNVTLYAMWTFFPGHSTVTYDNNGATGGSIPIDSNLYGKDYTVTVLNNTGGLVRTGYVFGGWNTATDGSGTTYYPCSTFTMGSANVILHAVWNPGYSVTYNGNGADWGAVPVDYNGYKIGDTVTVQSNGNLGRLCYSFYGWAGKGSLLQPGSTFIMGSTSVTLCAEWAYRSPTNTLPAYKVTYDGNGSTAGTVPADNNSYYCIFGTPVTVLGNTGNLARTGFTFGGWNDHLATYQSGDTFAMGSAGSGNVVLSAVWLPAYTVVYDANGNTGGLAPTDSNSYPLNSSVTVSGNTGNLAKTGYIFDGWWINGQFIPPGQRLHLRTGQRRSVGHLGRAAGTGN